MTIYNYGIGTLSKIVYVLILKDNGGNYFTRYDSIENPKETPPALYKNEKSNISNVFSSLFRRKSWG